MIRKSKPHEVLLLRDKQVVGGPSGITPEAGHQDKGQKTGQIETNKWVIV